MIRLSDREIQVIECASHGMGLEETGKYLHLEACTIKSHRARIAAKVGSNGRGTQYIVTTAYRRGWLVPEWPPRPFKVAPRRMAILIDIANGLSNAEIAEKYTIAEDTVKTHIKLALKQFGARNRAHLVGIAFRTQTLVLFIPQRLAAAPDHGGNTNDR